MDQAASDYDLAGRVLHAGSIIMTHAVKGTQLPLSGATYRQPKILQKLLALWLF
jgi:hypothetical protein